MSAFRRLLGLFGHGSTRSRFDPPVVDRELVGHLFHMDHGLPQLDWGGAELWRQRNGDVPLRAVAGAWLDELRDALEGEYRRWRHERVEGLAPVEANVALRCAAAGDRAIKVIEESLRPVRGEEPIGDFAIIALARHDDYYSFLAHHDREDGESATSGGCYIADGADTLPLILLNAQAKWGIEDTIAHELTHHALRGMDLPLWVEEGLTQVMEERVTGQTSFTLDHEMVERQRSRWEGGLAPFLAGESFFSSFEDDQELSYHLAQWIVRVALSEQPKAFFAFVRACGPNGADAAAAKHLGCRLEDLGCSLLGFRESV